MLSPDALAALRRSHRAPSRLDILHSGKRAAILVPIDGSVQVEASAPIRRSLPSATFVDPTGQLSRTDVDDLLSAYDCEVAPYRGVRYSTTVGGVRYVVEEMEPLGVFGLTEHRVTDAPGVLTVRLSGQDRSMNFQTPMTRLLPISAGTPVETAIRMLLNVVQPGLSLLAMRTGFTCGPLLFPADIDVWAEAQKLAESVGARLFHDRTGQAVLAPAGPASDLPVAAYIEGEGLLQDLDIAEDLDTIRNVVQAENEDGSIRVTVEDLDPTSPTYSRGRYPRKVYPLKNPYIYSIAQAQQAATARLAYELGRSQTVAFTAIVDPSRDVDEVVTVHRPLSGLEHRGLVVASLDIPLAASGLMKVGCRESRLARDGRVLPDLPQVAA